jgi:CubicO group peptidase (beta-lactamase class C family)
MNNWRIVTAEAASLLCPSMSMISGAVVQPPWNWTTASPESQRMLSARLEAAWTNLRDRRTTGFLVIRNDKIVFERYASGCDRTKPHYTASMAKALVDGMSSMVALDDGRIMSDDPASRFVPQWANDPKKMQITIRHLATHTSGIEDAEVVRKPTIEEHKGINPFTKEEMVIRAKPPTKTVKATPLKGLKAMV